jgi:hypothetical protein
MPVVTERRRGGKTKTFVNEDAVAALLRRHGPAEVWIEDVFAVARRPGPAGEARGDGARQAFSFGEGKGILKGVCAGLGIQRRYVSPQRWKTDMGLLGAAKNASKPRAHQLLPACVRLLASEGKAEAALIALWAWASDGQPIRPLTPTT